MRVRSPWARTTPPPVATTRSSCAQISARTAASRRRNPSSPSISKMVATCTPVRSTRARSVSTNSRCSRVASDFPSVVLPAPIMPMRKMLPLMTGVRLLPCTVNCPRQESNLTPEELMRKKSPGRPGLERLERTSANHQRVFHDLRRDEDQKLRLVVLLDGLAEEDADDRDVAEERHLGHRRARRLLKDAAQDDRVAVV